MKKDEAQDVLTVHITKMLPQHPASGDFQVSYDSEADAFFVLLADGRRVGPIGQLRLGAFLAEQANPRTKALPGDYNKPLAPSVRGRAELEELTTAWEIAGGKVQRVAASPKARRTIASAELDELLEEIGL